MANVSMAAIGRPPRSQKRLVQLAVVVATWSFFFIKHFFNMFFFCVGSEKLRKKVPRKHIPFVEKQKRLSSDIREDLMKKYSRDVQFPIKWEALWS